MDDSSESEEQRRHDRGAEEVRFDMDEQWAAEDAVLQLLVGSTAEARQAAVILAMLPTRERSIEIDKVKREIDSMCLSKAFNMAPVTVQASVKYIGNHLSTLATGLPIEVELDKCSQLARDSLSQFRYFLRVMDDGGKELAGDEAFAKLLDFAQKEVQAKRELKDDIEKKIRQLQCIAKVSHTATCNELLVDKQEVGVKAAKRQKTWSTPASGKASSSSATSSSSKTPGPSDKKKQHDLAREASMRMFS